MDDEDFAVAIEEDVVTWVKLAGAVFCMDEVEPSNVSSGTLNSVSSNHEIYVKSD